MPYTKQWKSFDEQLDQLIDRGMSVTDRELALDYLDRIGYYRLSGYWYAFRKREAGKVTDVFKEGATFQNAVDLYVFDKRLRMLVMDALERIEIAVRVDVAYTLGQLDPFAHEIPALLHTKFVGQKLSCGKTRHQLWLEKHKSLIERSKSDFATHYRDKYGDRFAVWVACELWDFGELQLLFGGMRPQERNHIAGQYGVGRLKKSKETIPEGGVFASWLRSLNFLRNVCAHHARLWNCNIVDQPILPSREAFPWVTSITEMEPEHLRAKCFPLLLIVRHLMTHINPRSTWADRLKQHLLEFPELTHLGLNLQGMGAPEEWESIWSAE